MSTCMSMSRSNYIDMSIWKKHADHSTSCVVHDSAAFPVTFGRLQTVELNSTREPCRSTMSLKWRYCSGGGGGWALVFEVGYHPHKKIQVHVIRVVFQDQAMYARTCSSFRGAKTCKIGKKGCVFGHIDKFWKGCDGQIKKNTCKNGH